ncbi:MAG: tetratricopeptide repeat protein [Nannocystaceae bacterium]
MSTSWFAVWLLAAVHTTTLRPPPPVGGAPNGLGGAAIELVGEGGLPPPPLRDDEISDTGDSGAAGEGVPTAQQRRESEFQGHLVRGKRAERERRWRDAEREFRGALELEPTDPEGLRGRAHARHARTKRGRCPRSAIEDLALLQVYDPRGLWLTERSHLLKWTAPPCESYENDRLQWAEELSALRPGRRGRPQDVAALAARLHTDLAQQGHQVASHLSAARKQIERFLGECVKASRRVPAEHLHLAALIYRLSGQVDKALGIYATLRGEYPDDVRGKKAEEELRIQLRVAELKAKQAGPPTPEAEAALRRAVAFMSEGDLSAASAQLDRAIEIFPWFPEAYYRRADIHARDGEFSEAIVAFQTAIAMDPYNHAAYMALGLLYYKRFPGASDEEARTQLAAALRLRPDLHTLHFYLGHLHARAQRREEARQHFQKFIERSPIDDPQLRVARDALRDLERDTRELRYKLPQPAPDELNRLDPELQQLINEAYVTAELGDLDRARQGLQRARERYPEEPAVLNALAEVVYSLGGEQEANVFWSQSLILDDNQMLVHERLGLSSRDPDLATQHLRKAASLGSATARFSLSRRLWEQFSWFSASEELSEYLRQAGPYDLNWDRAERFRERIDQFFFRFYTVCGSLFGLALALVLWRVYRRLRGASLAQFLRQEPKSFPEVARTLSLIRHEILKHNTAFLSDVGQAIAVEAEDADTRAILLARRLFGDGPMAPKRGGGGRPRRGQRGIYGRFLGYIVDLEKVGRSHGVHLNLFRKDATFRAMIRAFEATAAHVDELRAPYALRSSERLELARVLERSGDVLGRRAFEQLSGTINSLCVVDVIPRLLISVLRRVAAEDQFGSVEIAPLRVRGRGARIRVFRTDLEDILANVLRNSLRSSVLYAATPIALAVDLTTEVDDITGLTTLAIRIKDQSTERLTNEMLRGRYVERGMGITADLLSRYDASIAVEPEPHWAKAVVLRFFVVEETSH